MSGGQYLMLFMVALLLLWLTDDPEKKEFRSFSLVMLLLLVCPASVWVLCKYQTAFYSRDALWQLLPVTALLAYGLVMALFRIMWALTRGYGRWRSAMPRQKERLCELGIGGMLTVLLFLCGTLSLAKTVTDSAGEAGVPDSVRGVLQALEIPQEENVYLVAPDEVQEWARVYSGRLLLPYGRNLWEPALSAYTYDSYGEELYELHDWINGTGQTAYSLQQEEELLSRCASAGYEYLVFGGERLEDENLQAALSRQSIYKEYGAAGQYVIYRIAQGDGRT